ncbi:MAG: hypothetical protein KF708_24715 [Pirellulales bacterium]|nr:hypothetical protein [Pirellulales bacterium]
MAASLWEGLVFTSIVLAPFGLLYAARFAKRAYDAREGRRAWPWLVLGNACVFLALGAFLLAAAECYFRFWYDTTDGLTISRVARQWSARHFRFNAAGFRDDHEYVSRPNLQRPRVTFLGDSFAVGFGIAKVEDRLSNLVQARSKKPREANCFANVGLDTGAQLDLIRRAHEQGYGTDDLVLVYCPNDVCDLIPEWRAVGEHINERVLQLGALRASYALDMFWCRWIAATDPAARGHFDIVPTGYGGETWRRQTERLRSLRDFCRENDIRFSIVLFPFLHDLDDEQYHRAYDQLETFCAREEIPFLNLLPILAPHAAEGLIVNRFDPHPNERAHSLAADAILEFLDELDEREPRAAQP